MREVSDLAGHSVSLGATGSGAAVLGERILHAAGLSTGADVPVLHLPSADAADVMRACPTCWCAVPVCPAASPRR
ncbi:hypothetical protein AB0D14_09220 [Streptomyces sp. NPDC048484]|uniref:hypothetical protein n=1 Tax=Streptomyces sp. NPDC048484 TaxID=3155146 RepID=UPI00341D8D3E